MKPYATIADGVFCRVSDGEELTNFSITSSRLYYDAEDAKRSPRYAVFSIHCNTLVSKNEEVLIDFDTGGILTQMKRAMPILQIYGTADRAKLETHIQNEVLKHSVTTQCYPYFKRRGLYNIEKSWLYVAGGEVLGLPSDSDSYTKNADAKFAHNATLSPAEAVEQFVPLLLGDGSSNTDVLANTYVPIWAYRIIACFRTAIESSAETTFPVLMVYGEPDTHKTSAVRMLALPYDRAGTRGQVFGEYNANAGGKHLIAAIDGTRDEIVCVDDVTVNGVPAKERLAREQTGSDVLHFAANTSQHPEYSSGKEEITERYFAGGLILTGEYPLRGTSSIERMIFVEVKEPLTTTSVEGRRLSAAVLRYFIIWMLPKLTRYASDLHVRLANMRAGQHGRLRTTTEFLLWALEAFWDFAAETCGLTDETKEQIVRESGQIIVDLMDGQADLVERLEQPQPKGDLFYYLRELYEKREIRIVYDKKSWVPCNEALIEKETVYISGKYLQSLLQAKPLSPYTDKQLGKRLHEMGVLAQEDNQKHTIKKHGWRVYAIKLTAFQKSARGRVLIPNGEGEAT